MSIRPAAGRGRDTESVRLRPASREGTRPEAYFSTGRPAATHAVKPPSSQLTFANPCLTR